MTLLVRFIPSKAKWRKDPDLEALREFDCRALKDLLPREQEDRVSAFVVEDIEKAAFVALLWAVTRKELVSQDYVLIAEETAEQNSLSFVKTPGNTGLKVLDDLHCELVPKGGLCVAKVISDAVWSKASIVRVGKPQLKQQVRAKLDAGLILLEDIHPELRTTFAA